MRGSKTAVWRNALGQEIVFDNYTFFLESIDMTGTAGIHTVESLAMTDGQVTLDHHLGAKTIPCSFAWKDVKGDRWMQAYLTSLFNPTVSGTLTVYTREETYSIDCYPQDFPTFQRDSGVSYVWRWNVDFVADYPCWRKGTQRVHTLMSAQSTLVSRCPFEIAPDIYLPACGELWLAINGKGMTISAHEEAIVIKTETLKVITADDGENCNYLIDAQYEIDRLRIRYGTNTVICALRSNNQLPEGESRLCYYNLSMGEV